MHKCTSVRMPLHCTVEQLPSVQEDQLPTTLELCWNECTMYSLLTELKAHVHYCALTDTFISLWERSRHATRKLKKIIVERAILHNYAV